MPSQDTYNNVNANVPVIDADGDSDQSFHLGQDAIDVYEILCGLQRQQVIDAGRRMSELTIPSVMPPLNYRVGDDLPGTNQSEGARLVNNLASKLMFMAFPPGQPMMRLTPNVPKLQKEIDQDPELYANVELALSQVEMEHRKKAAAIGLATAWVGYIKLLLIGGNALWKHVTINCPTFHPLTEWACSRDASGHPLVTIHSETKRLVTLDKDVQKVILAEQDELSKQEEWTREARIFSVCRFMRGEDEDGEISDKHEDGHWEYWEETEKGTLIPGSEVETDYDDCPMWPGWCIPVYGQNYGRSYCEEYRGDFYILESNASALNDGAAMASLALTFVKPGSRTSLRQVQQARNLAFLSGDAADITTFRSEKSADFQFVANNFTMAAQRLAKAFLDTAAAMRQGERVTAEEVTRVGQALDQAMGGVYTEIAQGHQKRMVQRMVRLNTESSKGTIPALPPDLVSMNVITGVDAMGRSSETQNLSEFARDINEAFPATGKADQILDSQNYATRQAASRGIKPDGLVRTTQQIASDKAAAQNAAMQAATAPKVAGAVAGPMASGMMERMQAPPGSPAGAQVTPPGEQQ